MNGDRSARGRLSGIRELSLATLSLTWRCKREFSLLVLLALASNAVSVSLISNGARLVFVEELSEVWNRVSGSWDSVRSDEPYRWLQEYQNEVGSIQLDPVSWGLPMLIGGATIYMATLLIHFAAASRVCATDLLRLHRSVAKALRHSMSRVTRLLGFSAVVLGCSTAIVVMLAAIILVGVAMVDVFVPASVILFALAGLTVLALGAAVLLMPSVLIVAFVTSAVGPKEPTLRYTMRLIRGRFWATLGRAYLIAAAAVAVGAIGELVVSTVVPDMWHAAVVAGLAIELAGFAACTAGACVLYRDLGGEVT